MVATKIEVGIPKTLLIHTKRFSCCYFKAFFIRWCDITLHKTLHFNCSYKRLVFTTSCSFMQGHPGFRRFKRRWRVLDRPWEKRKPFKSLLWHDNWRRYKHEVNLQFKLSWENFWIYFVCQSVSELSSCQSLWVMSEYNSLSWPSFSFRVSVLFKPLD